MTNTNFKTLIVQTKNPSSSDSTQSNIWDPFKIKSNEYNEVQFSICISSVDMVLAWKYYLPHFNVALLHKFLNMKSDDTYIIRPSTAADIITALPYWCRRPSRRTRGVPDETGFSCRNLEGMSAEEDYSTDVSSLSRWKQNPKKTSQK